MSVIEDVQTRILAESTISGLASAKVYVGIVPHGTTLPYLRLFSASTISKRHQLGMLGVGFKRIQIDIYAAKPSQIETVSEALRLDLHGFKGLVVAGGTFAKSVHFSGPDDSPIPPSDGGEQGTHHGICELEIFYNEPTA